MILHEGSVAEMHTGEGKTLMATLPAYLNALTGRGVHIVTANSYLAQRDAAWWAACCLGDPMLRLKAVSVAAMDRQRMPSPAGCRLVHANHTGSGWPCQGRSKD